MLIPLVIEPMSWRFLVVVVGRFILQQLLFLFPVLLEQFVLYSSSDELAEFHSGYGESHVWL